MIRFPHLSQFYVVENSVIVVKVLDRLFSPFYVSASSVFKAFIPLLSFSVITFINPHLFFVVFKLFQFVVLL